MKEWLLRTLCSWVAALVMLALVSVWGIAGDSLPRSEWPPAMAATGVLHFVLSAALFQPVFYLLDRLGARSIAPFVLAVAGLVPLTLFVMAFGGTAVDIVSPEGRLFAAYFITAGGVFGLIAARSSKA